MGNTAALNFVLRCAVWEDANGALRQWQPCVSPLPAATRKRMRCFEARLKPIESRAAAICPRLSSALPTGAGRPRQFAFYLRRKAVSSSSSLPVWGWRLSWQPRAFWACLLSSLARLRKFRQVMRAPVGAKQFHDPLQSRFLKLPYVLRCSGLRPGSSVDKLRSLRMQPRTCYTISALRHLMQSESCLIGVALCCLRGGKQPFKPHH